ncbi:hypothetical protein ACFQL4_22830 [Halosimplex aquaticum]
MVEASPVAAALLLVLGAVGAVPVAALAGSEAGAQQAATDGNETVAPGEQFAGVVGVQQAEVSSEVDARAFGQRIAAAGSNRSAAGVVAAEVGDLDERLAELESQLSELERAHENGTVSEGQYRARLAKLHAEQRAIERRLNQTEQVARGLPAEALEAKGVNATAIDRLRTKASEMTGPEVAAVARSIAGKNAGGGWAARPPPVHRRSPGTEPARTRRTPRETVTPVRRPTPAPEPKPDRPARPARTTEHRTNPVRRPMSARTTPAPAARPVRPRTPVPATRPAAVAARPAPAAPAPAPRTLPAAVTLLGTLPAALVPATLMAAATVRPGRTALIPATPTGAATGASTTGRPGRPSPCSSGSDRPPGAADGEDRQFLPGRVNG